MAAVCVFCSSSERIDQAYRRLAADVGTELARRGHTLVSGGGRLSAMGEVARAVRAGGSRTVGVIPRALIAHEVADDDADELVVTLDMRERKGEMERRSDGFLTLPGGLGTLEELLEIWVGRTLGLHGHPVVVLDPDDTYAPLRAQVDLLVERGFVRPAARQAVRWARSPAEAIDLLEAAWAAPDPVSIVAPLSAEREQEMLEAEP